jgi:hypothetical protein
VTMTVVLVLAVVSLPIEVVTAAIGLHGLRRISRAAWNGLDPQPSWERQIRIGIIGFGAYACLWLVIAALYATASLAGSQS